LGDKATDVDIFFHPAIPAFADTCAPFGDDVAGKESES